MPSCVRYCFRRHEVIAGELRVQLRSGISVSDGHLDCLDVEFLCEIERALDCLLRFSRQADDEVPVNPDADLFAVFSKFPGLFDCSALLDVLQDLRIARFKSDDK